MIKIIETITIIKIKDVTIIIIIIIMSYFKFILPSYIFIPF